MAGYTEETGDLFNVELDRHVLAHCISGDVKKDQHMNAGIAKIFRARFPAMAADIEHRLLIGTAVRYTNGKAVVYNLVSKPIHSDKVYHDTDYYYRNLTRCLEDLRKQMEKHGEKCVAMPRIACGLDGGDWRHVRKIIRNVFAGSDIDVIVRVL